MTETIAEFLVQIGLVVERAELSDATFLPGIELRGGRVRVDPDRLLHPGDLLHEAGHLAVLPPHLRVSFGDGDDEGPAAPAEMGKLEIQAIAWSYAALVHLGLDPAVLFHDGGYRGHSPGLLRSFALGVYVGVDDLQAAGLTATPRIAAQRGIAPYPHMTRWLRD